MIESEPSLPFEKIKAWMYRTAIRRYIDLYQRDKRYNEILQKEFFIENNLYYNESENFFELHKDINGLQIPYSSFEENYSITSN
ncbi:hypothetical protein A7N10_09095 [Streptococcus iniae]|nr:hypothetical protein BMF34_00725 [Streptococcus iniae]EKB52238.1 ECF family RNA polymerase sigma-70 factor [Streptococcus iniae 9117]OAS91762.1 hypothetical protein A7N10_09095 [Streptococcus iniae]